MDEQTLRKLRSKLDKALAANQHEEAIRLLTQLSAADSANARWPHKQGDLLRKLERYRDAASAYAAAADLYAAQGFLSRAVAVAKAVVNLDPRRLDVLERIDPDAAKQFRRNLRPPTQPLRQGPARVDEHASGAGPARGRPATAGGSGAAVTRPSRVGGAAPEREAPPVNAPRRATMQGFAGGPVARAPAASDASKAGAARSTPTAKTGPVQGPPSQAGVDAPGRAAADAQARTVAASGGPVMAPLPAASRSAQPLPAAPQRLTMPGRRHPMVLDDDEPVPAPGRPVRPGSRQAVPNRAHAVPVVPQRLTMPGRRHPMVSDDDEPVPAPAVPPSPPQVPANRAHARVEPPAPRTDASPKVVSGPPDDDDEIIIVIVDDELESANDVTPATAAADEKRQPMAATPAKPVASVDRLSVPPPRHEQSQPSAAAASAKPVVSLDRLSVPPPRQGPAGATSGAPAQRGIERASPSPLPARPARAFELAPPAALGDAERLELPTGKVPPLPAAHPTRRRPEPRPQTAGGQGLEPRAAAGAEPRSLDAEWSDEAPEEFSRALEAAAPASIVPPTAADVEAARCVEALLRLPLFAKLEAQTLVEIAADSSLIELGTGASVVQRGKLSDSVYGILSGSAMLSGPDRSYELELLEGHLFGEACVLNNEPCQADVYAAGQLHALKIPRANLARLLKRKPRLADQLLGLLTTRLRFAFLASSLFRELDPDSREELGARFEVRRASKGRVLAEHDAPIEGLYVSLTGRLTVEKSGFVSMVAPAFSLFGHQLLLSSKRSPATITARRNLVLLRLSAATFAEVVLRYPRFAAHLAKHVSSDVVPLD